MLSTALDTKRIFTISEASRHLGVSAKTLRRWEKKIKFTCLRTSGNQRRYTKSQLKSLVRLIGKAEQYSGVLQSNRLETNLLRSYRKAKASLQDDSHLAVAVTQDALAEGLKIESINPNSLYSTTFLIALDFSRFILAQVLKRHQITKKGVAEFFQILEEESVQVLGTLLAILTTLEITARVFAVTFSLLLLLAYRLFETITHSILMTWSAFLHLFLIHYPTKAVKATHQVGSTTLFTTTLFAEIAWELSKDFLKKKY